MPKRVSLNDIEGDGGRFAVLKSPEEMNAGDRRAIKGAVPILIREDGSQEMPGDYDEQMKNALLARIITEWNLQYPVPKGDASILDKIGIDESLRLYDAVDEHVTFLNEKIVNPNEVGSDPTGGSAS